MCTTPRSTRTFSAEEVAYIVNDSESRVVFTSAAKSDVAAQLPALCPNVERWIMVAEPGAAAAPFESWAEAVGTQATSHSTTSSSVRR